MNNNSVPLRRNNKTLMLCMCAVFTALTAVGAFIKIPLPPVPFTLQFEFTTLAGLLLGKKYGALSVAVYVFLGLAGVPVFTQGGGIYYFLVPSFGYLLGFIASAYLTGFIAHKKEKPSFRRILAANYAGLALVNVIGFSYCYILKNFVLEGEAVKFWPLFLNSFLLIVPKDIILCAVVAAAAVKIIPATEKYRV